MEKFHILDDSTVILRSRGVYRQVAAYRREHDIFAPFGGGFIKLMGQHGTSKPQVSWDDVEGPHIGVDRQLKPRFVAMADLKAVA